MAELMLRRPRFDMLSEEETLERKQRDKQELGKIRNTMKKGNRYGKGSRKKGA